jgi:hypothetical protein
MAAPQWDRYIAFFDTQDAENEFIRAFDDFKHRFIEFTIDVF